MTTWCPGGEVSACADVVHRLPSPTGGRARGLRSDRVLGAPSAGPKYPVFHPWWNESFVEVELVRTCTTASLSELRRGQLRSLAAGRARALLIRVILGLESGWGLEGPLRPALGGESGLVEAAVAPGLGEEAKPAKVQIASHAVRAT